MTNGLGPEDVLRCPHFRGRYVCLSRCVPIREMASFQRVGVYRVGPEDATLNRALMEESGMYGLQYLQHIYLIVLEFLN